MKLFGILVRRYTRRRDIRLFIEAFTQIHNFIVFIFAFYSLHSWHSPCKSLIHPFLVLKYLRRVEFDNDATFATHGWQIFVKYTTWQALIEGYDHRWLHLALSFLLVYDLLLVCYFLVDHGFLMDVVLPCSYIWPGNWHSLIFILEPHLD